MKVFVYLLLVLEFQKVHSSIALVGNVYNGISVALNSSLLKTDCENIVDSIKYMFENASVTLRAAASGLTFGSINILVPDTWDTCGDYSVSTAHGYMTWDTSDVRVGEKDPLFGVEPWTDQPRGCGLEGEFIYLSSGWLLSSGYTDQEKGIRFVHEWAKYRWGVFEEHGHYGDPVLPESSRESDGSWAPNYCTNTPLNGGFTSACSSSSDCEFFIENSSNVSSSIMAVPQLDNMKSFCNSSNHRSDIPSKQNLICNYTSTWEIISKHSDVSQSRLGNSGKKSPKSVSVTVLRENFQHSVVIAYETSSAMQEITNRFTFEKESIAQLIMYEAPSTSTMGLVSFSSVSITKSDLLRLDTNKNTLAKIVLSTEIDDTTSAVNLNEAIKSSANILPNGNGVIVLITKCIGQDPTFTAEELAQSADGHPVWIILYPKNVTTHLEVYSNVTYLTGGKLIFVEDEITDDNNDNRYTSPNIRMKLSQSLRQLLHLDESSDVQQIAYETCEITEYVCNRQVSASKGFGSSMYIYIYHDIGDLMSDLSATVPNGYCVLEVLKPAIRSTNVFKCSVENNESTFDIRVTRSRSNAIMIMELVGQPIFEFSGYQFHILGSSNLYDLRYSETTAPAIFVQISLNGAKIVYANVSASVTFDSFKSSYGLMSLNDNGIAADVTGNDGIYSGYLVPDIPVGKFSISVYADDNKGKARLLPTSYTSGLGQNYVCCGSILPLPDSLSIAPTFSLSKSAVSAVITYSPSNLNLPPGIVKDFQVVQDSSASVTLSFTTTGENLDYGIADHYVLKRFENEMNNLTEENLPYHPSESGILETIEVRSFSCNKRSVLSIYAVDGDGLKGDESNRVTIYVPCVKTSNNMSVGASVGIAILAIVIVILILGVIIVLILRNKKDKDGKGRPIKIRTCSCCGDSDNNSSYNNKIDTQFVRNNERPPVQPIRTINDLVLNADNDIHQESFRDQTDEHNYTSSIDDRDQTSTPYTEDGYATETFKLAYINSSDSERSLQSARTASPFASTHAINNIGIPYGQPPSISNDLLPGTRKEKSSESLYNTQV